MQELLRKEVQSDERIIWSGIPQQGLMLRASDTVLIPFSLMWGGIAIFWEFSVISSGAPFFFMLWGIPFALAGIYLIVGRFFYDSSRRANTIYGLTDKRAIIISGLFSKKITSLNLKNLSEIQVKANKDGSGTITLGASNQPQFFQNSSWPGMSNGAPSFEGINDVQRVKQYIRQYQIT